MLQGKLIFFDEHLGEVTYDVKARDSFSDLKMHIDNYDFTKLTNYQNGIKLFDKAQQKDGSIEYPYSDADIDTYRRLDVSKANKYKSNITNRDFCLKVSSLIRYVQMYSKKNYNQLIDIVTSDDYFDTRRRVDIDGIGYAEYDSGLMTAVDIRNKYLTLVLQTVDDETTEETIFRQLKMKDNFDNILSKTPISNVGFSFSEEILGFKYEAPVAKEPANILGLYETMEEVIENVPHKNTDWILKRDYHIVTDENLEEIVKEFEDYNGYIAFDTETTGLRINFKSRTGEADELVGVVLSKEIGTGYYFPLQHKLIKNLCEGDHWFFMERYMRKILESKKIVCHNLSFDWKVAYIYGINVNCVYDTMLAFGVTKRYETPDYKYGLKDLTKNLFGLDMLSLSDFVVGGDFGNSGVTFADLPYELVKQYAPVDGDMTLTIFAYLEKEAILAKYGAHKIFDMEVNFSKAVAYSEFYGYHIDVEEIPRLTEEINSNMKKYSDELFKLSGHEFNPNSPTQLMKVMYDELGIEVIGKKRSTNKDTLNALIERTNENGDIMYPFALALKNYRDNEGIHKNFLKRLHEFATPDGYIFPGVQQLGTNTGRLSVKDPNYQSYNDPVKKRVTPREGFMHFDTDFSQIEYRVLASLAQQEQLMAEFDDPDLDYHTYQASRMFSIPYSLVSKALRSQSKGINFGLPYGMGDPSLGARIFGERTKANTVKASKLRGKFFQGQEKIQLFFDRVRSEGVANGFTSTHFGRRRYYQKGVYSTSSIRRQAGNHVIQGTAADIYKESVNRLFNRVVAEGWLGLVLFNTFVHDELLVEIHKSINPYYFFKAWREEFELDIDGFCKLYAGAGVGMSWYEAKKQDLPVQYIQQIIDGYHEDMAWDGDTQKFIDDSNKGYEEYKDMRIGEYITEPTNQGEVIKPVIYSLLVEKVEGIVKEVKKDATKTAHYNLLLEEPLINQEDKKTKISKLRDYLAIYCENNSLDLSSIDIKSPDEIVVAKDDEEELEDSIMFKDDEFSIADLISLRGYYKDDSTNIVYFTDKKFKYEGLPTTVQVYLMNKGVFKHEGKYQVALHDEFSKETTLYQAYIDETGYDLLMSIYTMLRNSRTQFA